MSRACFRIKRKSKKSLARIGVIKTAHGLIKTPFFMPIATVGAVKTLTTKDLVDLGAPIVLSNTYHLMLRPGEDLIAKAGGLHQFMNWSGLILTDSGGFQVFSLAKMRKITDQGVRFQSHLDGREYLLSPEKAVKIQQKLGSDMMMVLDECVEYPTKKEYVKKSIVLTFKWAKRCKEFFENQKSKIKNQNDNSKIKNNKPLLFGIIQGSIYPDLRLRSLKEITSLNFDGYAIGGLAVGEPEKEMYQILDLIGPLLPEDKPHYLMGLGKPEQIVEAVKRGIDMFDCVIPTREARHGRLYLWSKRGWEEGNHPYPSLVRRGYGNFYEIINIQNAKFKNDFSPLNSHSKLAVLRQYSKAYLRHLFLTKEPLALRLATLNNLEFYLDLMKNIQLLIQKGKL